MANVFKVSAIFTAFDEITKPLQKMGKSLDEFSAKNKILMKNLNTAGRTIGSGFGSIAGGIIQATIALTAFRLLITDTFKIGIDFEKVLASAGAKFDVNIKKGTSEYAKIEAAARQVGKMTQFTAVQAAQGLEYLALAGFKVDQAISALPGVVDLATAANLDLARASMIATNSLGGFGLMTKDTEQLAKNLARVNDVFLLTSTTFSTDVEQLFEAVRQAAPIAKQVGVSVEQFSAYAGVLSNAGIKSERAGIALRNIFIRFNASVGQGTALLRKLGIQTKDSQGNIIDMTDIIGQLAEKLNKMGSAQRIKYLSTIFGKEAVASASVLMGNVEAIKEYTKQLEHAAGTTEKMAKIMRETFQGRIFSLISAFQDLQLILMNHVSPGLGITLDLFTGFFRLIGQPGPLKEIIKWLVTMLEVFIPLITIVKLVTTVIWLFNLALAANPIILFTILVSILIGTLIYLYKNWDRLRDGFFGFLNTAASQFLGWVIAVGDTIVNFFIHPLQSVIDMLKWVSSFFKSVETKPIVTTILEKKEVSTTDDVTRNYVDKGEQGEDVTLSSKLIRPISSNVNNRIGGQIDVNFNNAPKDAEINTKSYNDFEFNLARSSSF
jgi:TP901 family phage tail tape measure protein